MESYQPTDVILSVILWIFIIFLVIKRARRIKTEGSNSPVAAQAAKQPSAEATASIYHYGLRKCVMSHAEHDFYKILLLNIDEKYSIFPQVHLSKIIFPTASRKKAWFSAFRHINQKSVDYVICDKRTVKPLLAIELDDWSHDMVHRQARDTEVERMLQEAGLPLVRFRNFRSLRDEDIVEMISRHLPLL